MSDDFDSVLDLLEDLQRGDISRREFRERMRELNFDDAEIDEYLRD